MADMMGDPKKKKPLNLAGLTALQNALDCKTAHTSFGKLPLSLEKSQPLFSFGTGKRFNTDKLFLSKELAKQSHIGQGSPGPIYGGRDDQQKYKKSPNWRFGSAERVTWETRPKYDFYLNSEYPDDPVGADHARKEACLTRKFGTESRFNTALLEKTPGPKYYPNLKPEIKNSDKYTFGFRRSGGQGSGLSNAHSTPNNVGPANYMYEKCALTGSKQNAAKFSIPKAPRAPPYTKTVERNQTYSKQDAVGKQNLSYRRTSPSAHFGTSDRTKQSKLGQFKDMMSTQDVRVRIDHPKM